MVESGIYEIVNTVNGHRYVGSSVNLTRRWNEHKRDFRMGAHKNKHLLSAWNLYGATSFVFNILEKGILRENLLGREQFFIDYLKPEYNISPTAGNNLGTICSYETKTRIGQANKGHICTEETKKKIGEANRGRHHTEEAKRKIGDSGRGEKSSTRKLSLFLVSEIRNKYSMGDITTTELGKFYGISQAHISKIILKQVWI